VAFFLELEQTLKEKSHIFSTTIYTATFLDLPTAVSPTKSAESVLWKKKASKELKLNTVNIFSPAKGSTSGNVLCRQPSHPPMTKFLRIRLT